MRGEFEIPGCEIWASANLEARPISVVPRQRRMRLNFTREFEFGDAAKILAQDFFFDFELMLVSGVLVVAPATAAEVRAWRRDAMRRGLDDGVGASASEAGLFFGDLCVNFFFGENERDENGLTASMVVGRKARESVAAIDELFNV